MSLLDYVGPYGLLLPCICAIFIYGTYTLLASRDNKKPKNTDLFLRGSKLVEARRFQKAIEAESDAYRKEIEEDLGKPLSLKAMKGVPFECSGGKSKVSIWEYVLDRHVAFIGATGAGKSTQIKALLERARLAGEKCIVLDVGGEICSELGRESDHILSLYDKRSRLWDPYQEGQGGERISSAQIAEFLVPSGHEHDKFWWNGARIVLRQLIDSCSSLDELRDLVQGGAGSIFDSLSETAKSITGDKKTPQSAGIIAHALMELSFLKDLNYWAKARGDEAAFSIYDWTQNDDKNWIFIPVKDDDFGVMSPLLKIWFNLAIIGCFARNPSKKHTKINIIIDEVSTIGKIENLGKSLDRLRKYSARCILAYQSESYFRKLYGHDEASAMLGQIGTKFIFRIKEPKHANEMSELLGSSEVLRKNRSSGRSGASGSYSETVATKPVVMPFEIQTLRDGWFYLSSLSFMPVKLRIRHRRWAQVLPLHRDQHGVPDLGKGPAKPEQKERFESALKWVATRLEDKI